MGLGQKNKKFKTYDPDKVYEGLVSKAPFVEGDNGEIIDIETLDWFDLDLLHEGQEFIWRNFWAEVSVMVSALLIGLTFRSVTTALLRNQGYSSKEASKRRHVETSIHVRNWLYGTNFFKPGDLGFKDFQEIRRLHVLALRQCEKKALILHENGIENKVEKMKIIEALQKDLAFFDTSSAPQHLFTYYPTVLFSQFDMAMVLFGMYAPIYLFPANLGLRDTRGMEGYLHFWAVVGRSLGIQDEFNVALYPDRGLQLKIYTNLILPSIKNLDMTMLGLGDIYLESLRYTPFAGIWTSYSSVLYTSLRAAPFPGGRFKGDNLYALLTWRDVIIHKLASALTFILYYVPLLGKVLNYIIHRQHRSGLRHYDLKDKTVKLH